MRGQGFRGSSIEPRNAQAKGQSLPHPLEARQVHTFTCLMVEVVLVTRIFGHDHTHSTGGVMGRGRAGLVWMNWVYHPGFAGHNRQRLT